MSLDAAVDALVDKCMQVTRDAVEAEREECAKEAEGYGELHCGEPVMGDGLANDIAAAIRARGQR